MSRRAILLLTALGLAAIALFFRYSAPPAPQGPLVLAASSLQEALEDAAHAWAAKGHPAPVLSFAASSALARQIEAGARTDLFLSADEEWMDHVERLGLLTPGSRQSFLANRLVLVTNDAAVNVHADGARVIAPDFPITRALGPDGRLALADPESVPAGKYARSALQKLGLWDSVRNRIAAAENVRAALGLVERRQARLGIVYETDAKAAPEIHIVGTFPVGSHQPITYPIAQLSTARSPDAAGFRAFLLSAEGRAIFRRRGFGIPDQQPGL